MKEIIAQKRLTGWSGANQHEIEIRFFTPGSNGTSVKIIKGGRACSEFVLPNEVILTVAAAINKAH